MIESTEGHASEPSFVVWNEGSWWHVGSGRSSSERLDWPSLVSLVEGTGAALEAWGMDPRPSADVVSETTVVQPAWCLAGRLTSGGVRFGTVGGATAVAQMGDLAVIDASANGATVAHLTALFGAQFAVTLDRLLARGWMRIAESRSEPEPESAEVHDDGMGLQETSSPTPTEVAPARAAPAASPDGPARVPVYAIWHDDSGPMLSLGMLTASARLHDGGALNDAFEIRRPESADSFLADLASRSGPAILLCSDYVWSVTDNLRAAKEGLAVNPDLLVLHGGPSCPKYEADAEDFLDAHGRAAAVLTRGEGEDLVCELLEALRGRLPLSDPAVLAGIAGLTFRDVEGRTVRTPDRERIIDLDLLPSPYLTGEFDDIPKAAWATTLSIETNRGCPYGCTYCDWGSSTLSRVRKFSQERVFEEIEWAAARGLDSLNITDANFGIMSRDVETAEAIAAQRRARGFPTWVSFYPAKNTTKHLTKIMDVLIGAQVSTIASISLQTTDDVTLAAIERSNISTDHYVALAAGYRRRGYPLQGELILGLPGQSYDSYRRDLQFNLDHEIQTRTWRLRVLPNAPMNDPEYRERFGIVVDENDLVQATSTFTEADRHRMVRLQDIDIICERLGVLRHVLRYVQWDHGVAATVVMDRLLTVCEDEPGRFPLVAWLMNHFHEYPTAPEGWPAFYEEVAQFLAEEFDIPSSSGLETAFVLNRFLMPFPGRSFPAEVVLDHDYLSYYRDATASLYESGHAADPKRSLDSYGPAAYAVWADPLSLCDVGLLFHTFTKTDGMDGDFAIGANSANELLSPLTRLLPHLITHGVTLGDLGPTAPAAQGLDLADQPPLREGVPVELGTSRSA